jgi:hypothetical protein
MSPHPTPGRPAARRLTPVQVVVLAAVERLGNPTIPELADDLIDMWPSEILRVLDALEKKEKVVRSGRPWWTYLGDPTAIPGAPQIPDEEIVRFRTV